MSMEGLITKVQLGLVVELAHLRLYLIRMFDISAAEYVVEAG
jgi:hypothetical protein